MGSPGGVSIVHLCVTGSPLPNSVTLLCIQYRQLEKVSADHRWPRRGVVTYIGGATRPLVVIKSES